MKPVYPAGILVALAVAVLPGTPAQATDAKPRTIVALTFDDGDATHLAAARMLQKRGMRGTFYINSGTVGGEDKLTGRQLAAIAKAGHEIGGHTLNHTRLTELLPEQQRAQICDDRRALMKRGYKVTTLAYPFGVADADARRTARLCGYGAARQVGGLKQWGCPGCPAAETLPPADRWAIRTPRSFEEDTEVRQMKQLVLNAEKAGGGLVPLVFHRVCDDCGLYSTPPERLGEFLDWLASRKSRGTVVRTMAEVAGGKPRPAPGN
ncbi:hypothetical protein GCM10010156_19260 [Planobispora rosea]|uniref:NodB homology domain-containing protein n=1 Tax=Planobispora rosea TaxID=35762 RepID=A0A8J3WC95_PLARO|nr:polysaccharide deacetylase family protein [Planobispora rosea]GGS60680.1 hypothetical protein GCM10010156_19260 [Planobispora rosea]GIH83975.1 hypothetical protein Pro02_23830 [Planobispora rosea]